MKKFFVFLIMAVATRAYAANELQLAGGADVNFGNIVVGQTQTQTYTLANTGTDTVYFYEFFLDFTKGQINFAGNGDFPGGGTCSGDHIAPGDSCTFIMTYAPASVVALKSNFKINYYYGNILQHLQILFHGAGINTPPPPPGVAVLTISDGPTYDFGQQYIGSTTQKTFLVSNTGGSSATHMSASGLAAPFAFDGGSYPGIGGTCTAVLASQSTCTIVVGYAPTTSAVSNGTVSLSYLDGEVVQTTTRAITGSGIFPPPPPPPMTAILQISNGPVYDFGTHVIGDSADVALLVSNAGTANATAMTGSGLAAPFSFKGGSYPGTGGTCTATLAPQANCSIVLTYAPVTTGVHSGTVQVNYFDGVTNQTAARDLQGVSSAPALLVIDQGPTADFGTVTVGQSADHLFRVTNTGGVAATQMREVGMSAPFGFKGGTYPGTGGTCSLSLAASDTCTIVVTFTPTSIGGFSGTITMAYNDGILDTQTERAIQGTGAEAAILSIDQGPTASFGNVMLGSPEKVITFTLTNTGGAMATQIDGGTLNEPFAFSGTIFPGTGGTCGVTLAAGQSCSFVVTFSPRNQGVYNDTISISYNDGATVTNTTRPITGAGVTPALLKFYGETSYDYGTVETGIVKIHPFMLGNYGGSPATGVNGGGLMLPFRFAGNQPFPGGGGTCTDVIMPGKDCMVRIAFAPTDAKKSYGQLTVLYNDGVSGQQLYEQLRGQGAKPKKP